jgi:hypothetical protein
MCNVYNMLLLFGSNWMQNESTFHVLLTLLQSKIYMCIYLNIELKIWCYIKFGVLSIVNFQLF